MYNDEFELTPDERAALAALPREMQPSDLLEERVVRALRAEGQLGAVAKPRSNRGIMAMLRVAAAIALFAGGVATGRYLLASDSPQSASVQESSAKIGPRDSTLPASTARQVKKNNNERIVAEREMWL